jgi:hypothetical protein
MQYRVRHGLCRGMEAWAHAICAQAIFSKGDWMS